MTEDYKPFAVKRTWVPEWLWDVACHLLPLPPHMRLPLYQPFRWVLTEPFEQASPGSDQEKPS